MGELKNILKVEDGKSTVFGIVIIFSTIILTSSYFMTVFAEGTPPEAYDSEGQLYAFNETWNNNYVELGFSENENYYYTNQPFDVGDNLYRPDRDFVSIWDYEIMAYLVEVGHDRWYNLVIVENVDEDSGLFESDRAWLENGKTKLRKRVDIGETYKFETQSDNTLYFQIVSIRSQGSVNISQSCRRYKVTQNLFEWFMGRNSWDYQETTDQYVGSVEIRCMRGEAGKLSQASSHGFLSFVKGLFTFSLPLDTPRYISYFFSGIWYSVVAFAVYRVAKGWI